MAIGLSVALVEVIAGTLAPRGLPRRANLITHKIS